MSTALLRLLWRKQRLQVLRRHRHQAMCRCLHPVVLIFLLRHLPSRQQRRHMHDELQRLLLCPLSGLPLHKAPPARFKHPLHHLLREQPMLRLRPTTPCPRLRASRRYLITERKTQRSVNPLMLQDPAARHRVRKDLLNGIWPRRVGQKARALDQGALVDLLLCL